MTRPQDAEAATMDHEGAIQALCDCAATVTVLSYQEAIEGYFKLRGLPVPAAPTPSGDLREAVARLIDPSKWRVLDSYLRDVQRIPNAGYDPDNFKDRSSLQIADQIIALIAAHNLTSGRDQ